MKKLVLSVFCMGFVVAATAQTNTSTTPKKTAQIKKLNKPVIVKKSVVTVSPSSPKAKQKATTSKQPVTRKESAVIEEKNSQK